jgi:hypothetical protein
MADNMMDIEADETVLTEVEDGTFQVRQHMYFCTLLKNKTPNPEATSLEYKHVVFR